MFLKLRLYLKALMLVVGIFCITSAQATIINLNDFFADFTVTVSADGSTATLLEDPMAIAVLLANDPSLGDPNVIVASANSVLSFDVIFMEGTGNDDAFQVTLFDANTLATLDDFFTDFSLSQLISFDLSPYIGTTLGLQFELRSFDSLFDSSVVISNVTIDSSSTAVPEPPTSLLACLGGLFLMASRLRKQ